VIYFNDLINQKDNQLFYHYTKWKSFCVFCFSYYLQFESHHSSRDSFGKNEGIGS